MFLGFALTLQFTIAALLASPIVLLSKGSLPNLFDRPLEYFKMFGPGVFCVSVILFYLNFWFHEAITKLTTGFKNIDAVHNRQLSNLVAQLAITAGIPTPKLGILSSQA